MANVLDALTSNPDSWASTVFLLTYDENDGFFDHVVPPYPPSSAAEGVSAVGTTNEIYSGDNGVPGPYGMGVRVPMIAISPWSTGGYVCNEVFDHTSIIRFMENRFGVGEPSITPWRRAVAGDLTSAFDFAGYNTRVGRLPSTVSYAPPDRDRHDDYVPTPPTKQSVPAQEPGTRPARPLKYDFEVSGSVGSSGLALRFTSRTGLGAAFQVRSGAVATGATATTPGPWTYTVAGHSSLSAIVPTTGTASGGGKHAYDLEVSGPNGFVRSFAGSGESVEVTARRTGDSLDLQLVFSNTGPATELTVADGYHHNRGTRLSLRRGGRATLTVSTRAVHGWYDLRIGSSSDAAFARRLAGRLETGAPSISDPNFG